MKFIMLALAVLSFGRTVMAKSENPFISELTFGVKEHPIGKVINMLEELKEKAKVEGEEEEANYQKFKNWCDNSKKELSNQISKEKDEIEELKQSVSAKEELISGLEADIEFLTKQLEEQTVSGDEAKKIREEQNKAWEEADKDFDSTITAITEVIESLKSTKAETDSLLSRKTVRKVLALAEGLVPEKDQQMLVSLLNVAPPKPQDKVYTFKSGNVIELLESLKKKFEMDKEEAAKAETASLNEYNVAKGAREDALKAAEEAKGEKETLKGEAETALEEMKATLSETEEDLAANEKAMEKTTTLCKLKADEWRDRQFARSNEIKAMDTAMEILAKVQGVRHEVPGKDTLMQKATSFLQIDDPKMKAVKILVSEAQKLHSKSKALQNLINQIKQHKEGPFDEIIQMIQKMIFRVMAEQKDEDDHKMWCDTETEKSNGSKEHNEKKKEELELKIDEGEKKVQQLSEDVATLTEEVTTLETEIKESTEIRNEEHEENVAAIKDAQDAQAAISKAVAVLSEYYKSVGQSFIQVKQHEPVDLGEAPETWDASYSGVSDAKAQPDGIISVLEAVSEDFAKMEADTKAQEDSDQKAYDEELTSNMMDKAEKEQSIEIKTHEKTRLQGKLKNWNDQKKHVLAELETVLQYLKDLEGACGEGEEEGASYEDRKKARTDEIAALREAQNILTNAFKDSGFLQKKANVKAHQ